MLNKIYLFLLLSLITSLNLFANDIAPAQKISSTGAVFTLNLTHPELGDAYQDPSGLIWGDLVIVNKHVVQANYSQASAYCKDIGARLPTLQEFLNLAKYLGAGTKKGYNPSTSDGQDTMLLGLPYYWYWTSTPYWFRPKDYQYAFWGDSGGTQDGNIVSKGGAIHCVVQP
jgi:hypothetical protein